MAGNHTRIRGDAGAWRLHRRQQSQRWWLVYGDGAAGVFGITAVAELLLHALLVELAREGAPVHTEPARGFRDVKVGFSECFVDTLPLQSLD